MLSFCDHLLLEVILEVDIKDCSNVLTDFETLSAMYEALLFSTGLLAINMRKFGERQLIQTILSVSEICVIGGHEVGDFTSHLMPCREINISLKNHFTLTGTMIICIWRFFQIFIKIKSKHHFCFNFSVRLRICIKS